MQSSADQRVIRKQASADPEDQNLLAHEAIEAPTEKIHEAHSENNIEQLWESWCLMVDESLVKKAAREAVTTDGDLRQWNV